jgi:hypothetical protein
LAVNATLIGAGIGALLTYFFDPSGGRERRQALRSRVGRMTTTMRKRDSAANLGGSEQASGIRAEASEVRQKHAREP